MKLKKLLLITFILLNIVFINNVYAYSSSFDGAGQSRSSDSSNSDDVKKATTGKSGWALMRAIMLKFSLVDVTNDKPLPVSSIYVANVTGNMDKEGTYSCANTDNYCYKGYFERAGCKVQGLIVDGTYTVEGEVLCDTDTKERKYKSNWEYDMDFNRVLPDKAYLNFNMFELKNQICQYEDPCNLNPGFKRLVKDLFNKGGVDVDLDNVTQEQKIFFSNYRIFIEPVYAFASKISPDKDTNFFFATPKALGVIGRDGVNLTELVRRDESPHDNYYGVFLTQLVGNAYALNEHGNAIKSGGTCAIGTASKCYESLADSTNGRGYAIISVLPDEEEYSCSISKNEDGSFSLTDRALETKSLNEDNLTDFFTTKKCCSDFKNSTYFGEITDDSLYAAVYNENCNKPKEDNSCSYIETGTGYTFNKKNGKSTNDYGDFIRSCTCGNEKVQELKEKNGLSLIYFAECEISEEFSTDYHFEWCGEENTASWKSEKKFGEYCTRTCNENIKFDVVNTKEEPASIAGQYFELSKKPKLLEEKSCNISFNYTLWKGLYSSALSELVTKYNNYKKYSNLTTSYTTNHERDGSCSYLSYSTTSTYDGFAIDSSEGSGLKIKQAQNLTWTDTGTVECSNTKDYSSDESDAEKEYLDAAKVVEDLKSIVNKCNALIDFEGEDYYNPDNELYFYYQQDIIKEDNTIEQVWNYERNINDSKMKSTINETSKLCNGLSTEDDCKFDKIYLYDTISDNNIEKNYTKFNNSTPLTRYTKFVYEYTPPVNKSVTNLIGQTNETSKGIKLEYVYDIDIKAKAKDTNLNQFVFTKIGNNPSNKNSLDRLLRERGVDFVRACEYSIVNELVACGDNCPETIKPSLNITFRMVDPLNIDPNGRIGTDKGFKNWNTENAKAVKKMMESSDTFNPENIEYSFVLDSETIEKIRNYNKMVKYSEDTGASTLECESDGNKCKSTFITNALEGTSINGDDIKQFAFITKGREKWKELTTDSNKCYIDGVEVKDLVCTESE